MGQEAAGPQLTREVYEAEARDEDRGRVSRSMRRMGRRCPTVDRDRLSSLLEAASASASPHRTRGRASASSRRATASWPGVPMSWMARWAGGHPVYLAEAHGAHVTDVDGNEYVDLCLGDTGAMAGHSPAPVAARRRGALRRAAAAPP